MNFFNNSNYKYLLLILLILLIIYLIWRVSRGKEGFAKSNVVVNVEFAKDNEDTNVEFAKDNEDTNVKVTDIKCSICGECKGASNIIATGNQNGGKTIGKEAFQECNTLETVTIGTSVTSIGDIAFRQCKKLTSIQIPDSVESIGNGAFNSCSELDTVTIGTSVASIGSAAFRDCKKLTSIYIPDSVESIGNYAFEGCTELATVTIGTSVVSIGEQAFKGCKLLESIEIPNSVTSIGENAFSECPSLTTVTINYNPKYLLKNWPRDVFKSTSINKARIKSNTQISSDEKKNIETYFHSNINNQVVVVYETTEAPNCSKCNDGCQNETNIIVNTNIEDEAFKECNYLETVTIGNSVASIGEEAFRECKSLTSIEIPDSVESIGNMAFYYCTELDKVTIGTSVASIGNYTFSFCYNLTSINIPDSVTSIEENAFQQCYELATVTIGTSVTSIGSYAFANCYSLTSIEIPDSVERIGISTFVNCTELGTVTIGTGVMSIGQYAFQECYSLTSINIPNSVTSIGYKAFQACYSLTSIYIPDSVESIGDYAFYYCTELAKVTIGTSVASIGDWAFDECYSLTSINIPDSVTSIGEEAFSNCTELATVTIRKSVTSIGNKAFSDCSNLATVTINYNPTYPLTNWHVNVFQNTLIKEAIIKSNTQIPSNEKKNIENYFNNYNQVKVIYEINSTSEEDTTTAAPTEEKEAEEDTSTAAPTAPKAITKPQNNNCNLNSSKLDLEDCLDVKISDIIESLKNNNNENIEITFPSHITNIAEESFIDMKKINIVSFKNTNPLVLGESCFEKCNITLIEINNSNTLTLGDDCFKDCKLLKEIIVDDGDTFVNNNQIILGEEVFNECSALENINSLLENVKIISKGAFVECRSLTTINFPSNITEIKEYAFYNCSGLKQLTFNFNKTFNIDKINKKAFERCQNITKITINCNENIELNLTKFKDYFPSNARIISKNCKIASNSSNTTLTSSPFSSTESSRPPYQTIPPKLGGVFNYILHDKGINTKQRLDLILALTELYSDKEIPKGSPKGSTKGIPKGSTKGIPKGSLKDNSRYSAIEKIIKELKNQIYSDEDNTINDNDSLTIALRDKIKNNTYFPLTDEEKMILMRSKKDKIWETILQIAHTKNNKNKYKTEYEPGWTYVPPYMWETHKPPPKCLNDKKNVRAPAFVQGSGVPANALDLKNNSKSRYNQSDKNNNKYRESSNHWGDIPPNSNPFPPTNFNKFIEKLSTYLKKKDPNNMDSSEKE